jgi:hypothetical protein
MSEVRPPAVPSDGPHVGIAVLCEKVLQEGDGVLSLIRVVDRIIHSAVGPEAPDEMPPVPIGLGIAADRRESNLPAEARLRLPNPPAGDGGGFRPRRT